MASPGELLQQGVTHHQAGRLPEAEAAYRQVLQHDPNQGDALHLLGLIAHQVGNQQAAEQLIQRSVQILPNFAEAHNNLGVVYRMLGQPDRARACYQRALEIKPAYAEAHNNLGLIFQDAGQLEPARERYLQALKLNANYPEAHNNLGVVLRRQGQMEQAEACYRKALALRPGYVEALNNLGIVCRDLGRLDEALACCDRALKLRPNYAEALNNRGNFLQEKGDRDQAAENYRQAIQLKPDCAEAFNNLGVIHRERGEFAQARECYENAIRIKPSYASALTNLGFLHQEQGNIAEARRRYMESLAAQPDGAETLNNMSTLSHLEGRLDEARSFGQQAVRVRPRYAEAWNNLGAIERERGDLAASEHAFRQALGCKPEFAEAKWNLSLHQLMQGNFEEGWSGYESRWQVAKHTTPRKHFSQPLWTGEDLAGKTLLVHAEQGFGDTIQFLRYALLARDRGARVILEVQPPLRALLSQLQGIELRSPDDPLPAFDLHCPLLSLPVAFHTTLSSVPAKVPYLQADPERAARWKERLAKLSGFKIGIAWKGNPRYHQDRTRSIPLEEFQALAAVPGVTLVSLQMGPGAEQVARVKSRFDVVTFDDLDRDGAFLDSAAIISGLDLVVASDSAIVHLAGAMAAPVWTLLAKIPDWRWLLDRDDCPWYPTMKLLRQKDAGNWGEVFYRTATMVAEKIGVPTPIYTPAPPAPIQVTPVNIPSESPVSTQRDQIEVAQKLHRAGNLDGAEQAYRAIIDQDPVNAKVLNLLGLLYLQRNQMPQAKEMLQRAVDAKIQRPDTFFNLAYIQQSQNELEAARGNYRKAIALQPNYPEAFNNLGNVHRTLGELLEARDCYRQSIQQKPGFVDPHNNLGAVLRDLGDPEGALSCWDRVIALKPDHAIARGNRGLILLLLGRWTEAWPEYDWRWRTPEFQSRLKKLPMPLWTGQDLKGKSIFLRAEQGLGDMLQFARFVTVLKNRGAKEVVLECKANLQPLLKSISGLGRFHDPAAPPPACDYQAPLMSLARVLGVTPDTIPANIPYLQAEPARVSKWHKIIKQHKGFKIGVCWQGNPTFRDDRWRSIPLARYEPLAKIPGVKLICLQKGPGTEQIAPLKDRVPLIDLGPELDRDAAFLDTAAALMSVDLVVTSDTSIAHLAGALGVQVWLALPFVPDWRWLMHRADCPWYPTMRVFRQPELTAWEPVFDQIAEAIQEKLQEGF